MDSSHDEKQKELEELRKRIELLEQDVASIPEPWQAQEYYGTYYALTGGMLGIVGALTSLVFNVIGSLVIGQPPLRLIQIYLTFPMGEKALNPEFETGIGIAVGCCLYIGTGMVLGVPFQMAIARFLPTATLVPRLIFASVVSIVIWLVNFYLILSWLQPMLFGGNWIVDPNILPPWVAAATHLVFGWTMALVYPWGVYEPYRRQTEKA